MHLNYYRYDHTVMISSNLSSKHHPDYSDTNATLSLINLFIRRRPIFSDLGTNADFEAAFNQWQNDVVDSIKDLDFERYPGVEKIAGILAGDETTLDTCLPLVGQWYRLLIAKCFYLCPTTGRTSPILAWK